MDTKDELIVTIDNFDYQGRGIARIDGMTIFVAGALPGERVKIQIQKVHKKIAEASVVEVLETSNKRVKPECPYYGVCGGCDLMHLTFEDQNLYKENKIKEIMVRYGDVEPQKIKPLIKNEHPFYYRNKVTFQVKEKIGFYQKRSYEIIPVDACMIANPKINEILNVLKGCPLKNITQIVVRKSKYTEDAMVVIYSSGKIEESFILNALKPYVTSFVVNDGKERVVYGNPIIYEKLKDKIFAISPTSFFQVNTENAIKLYEKVLEYSSLSGKETVVDLYCGTGTIGIFVSDYAKEVLGIEINTDAVKNANLNKELNHADNISFLNGDVSKLIDEVHLKPDVVIVDPPRAGLDKHTIEVLLKMNPKKIVYVSCDPMTLARDLKLLKQYYTVVELTPVDMFSETYHVECVCMLNRR